MSLSVDLLQQIDACCDRFEAALRGGEGPDPQAYAGELPEAARQTALVELQQIESHYRGHTTGDDAATVAPPVGSAGLRLRCPHCQGGVEVLADAPLDQITCASCGSTFGLVDSHHEDQLAPHTVGRFRLLERLGVGGFGAVWRARDPELDRDVAVKVPRRGQLGPREAELFFREARAAAQLAHPGIVPVHEVGRDETPGAGRTVYIVSELIAGEPLSARLKRQRFNADETCRLLAEVSDALHYAHERGVIHRDLKPSNIMLDDAERPHLMDFGLAKREVGEITMTVEGQVLGTPAYMSPEQAGGQVRWVDRRTDIYALGVMLFQMLTGELPFRGTAQSQIQQRQTDDPPSPRRLNDRAPLDLATVCLKCLEREPGRRYDTALEVGDELRRYLNGEPVVARPLSRVERIVRWAKRSPASAAALTLGAVLAVAGPIAAVVIASQRAEIAEQLDQKLDQIAEDGETIDRLRADRDALRDQLTARGEIDTHSYSRQQTAEAWLDKHGEAAMERVARFGAPEPYARGMLGLGLMQALAERETEAITSLQRAEETLAGLAEADQAWRPLWDHCRRLLVKLHRGQNNLRAADRYSDSDGGAAASVAEALGPELALQKKFDEQYDSADADLYEIVGELHSLGQLPTAPE